MSETSAENNALQVALLAIGKEMGFFEFDGNNAAMKYSYASASGVMRKLNKLLTDYGVTLTPRSDLAHFQVTEDGKHHAVVHITLEFRMGQLVEYASAHGSGIDKGDKAVMKAETAATKYAIAHKFCMSWGAVDPDGDEKADTDAKAKGSKPAPRAEPEKRPVAEVVKAIAEATTPAQMKTAREMVLALKGDKGYDDLVKMFQTRSDELRKAK